MSKNPWGVAVLHSSAHKGPGSIHLVNKFADQNQFTLVTQSCPTLCDPKDCSTPGLPVHHPVPEFTQTHVHWVGDAIQPSHPLSSTSSSAFSLSSLSQPFPPSGSFPVSAVHIRWPKCWSLSFSISPLNEYSGLISFRIDWFYLLAVQGTLKSLLQYHKVLNFFMVQLSHPYMTTGKVIAMIIQTFVNKVMSLFFNMLSWFFTKKYKEK